MKFTFLPQITLSFFIFISHSTGKPIAADTKQNDWTLSKTQDNKPLNLVDKNKSMNSNVNSIEAFNRSDANFKDQIIKNVDEKLNNTNFSKNEIDRLSIFVRRGISSKSAESLRSSSELINRNTEALIEQYKVQKKACAIGKTYGEAQRIDRMNEACFDSFLNGFCPHFPFC